MTTDTKNYRDYLALTAQGLKYLQAKWGSRFIGAIGLFSDIIAEGSRQAFIQGLPGHPEQADDSLLQSGKDRGLWQFRGESMSAYSVRVQNVWDAREQAGTPQQMLRIIDQWGAARHPDTWVQGTVTLTENPDGVPTTFDFDIDIPLGLISVFTLNYYGEPGLTWGKPGFVWGGDAQGNAIDLYRIVKEWKPSRSVGTVGIEYDSGDFVFYPIR